MSFKSGAVVACVLLALGWGGTAYAAGAGAYLLTGNSGGRLQLGTGLPLPLGSTGIFLGGQTSQNGGTSCGIGPNQCPIITKGIALSDGPGTAFWPAPLLVPPNPNIATGGGATRSIGQTGGTGQGGAILVPTGVLSKAAPGGPPNQIGLFPTNAAVFQVATSISYSWPAVPAVLKAGGAPGIVGTTVFFNEPVSGGTIFYSGSTKAFGGPAQFSLAPGPGAAGGRVPPNTLGVQPLISGWINFAKGLPQTAMAIAIVGGSNPAGLAQPGAPATAPGTTTMFGPLTPANGPFGAINIPVGGTACTMFCVGSSGTITISPPGVGSLALPSVTVPTPNGTIMLQGLSNMVTISKGYPWTTGFITVAAPAVPPETFFLSGTDMRIAGVGNISLVSGGVSNRALSKQNANRGWLSLNLAMVVPEPTAALGTAGSLAILGLCHGLARRRAR